MARMTLKITKPVDPTALPKPQSSRAKRALHGKKLPKSALQPAAPVGPPDTPAAPSTPASAPPPRTGATDPGAAATSRRRRSQPDPGPSGPYAGPRNKHEDTGKPHGDRARADGAKPGRRDGAAPIRREAPPKGITGARPPAPFTPRESPRVQGKTAPAERWSPPAPYRDKPKPVALDAIADKPPAARHENPDDPRLSKRMSELGLCSRREADDYIENGWVKVNGVVITTLGTRVPLSARIEVDKAAEKHQAELVTILLNKPIGFVSGQAEHGYDPAMILIKPENHWAEDPSPTKFKLNHLRGLAPAGRLDIDSTGLLVFTQDGRIAKHLIGRDSAVEKEYLVRVEGTLSDGNMKLLQHGLELDGVKLKPAKVSWQNEDQLRFLLREGRKRQIRRMCELVGLTVTGLKRVRSGGVALGPLPPGQWRYLRQNETF